MASDLTRFDFHPYRFLNSEDVENMTAEEVGCYILLLCKSWTLGKEATLPDDMGYLAKQGRVQRVSDLVMRKFPVVDTEFGARRRNGILYGEWLLAKDRQESASERGKKGGRPSKEEDTAKLEESYSFNNSFTAAKKDEKPIPYHSIPDQSTPHHTTPKEPIRFAGGSFSCGDWKFISKRWYAYFQKNLSTSAQNKEQYASACSTYSEDVVLEYLEKWANENQWVASHPKGGNRLYVFMKVLPDMIEGDQMRKESEQKDVVPDASDFIAEQEQKEHQRIETEKLKKLEEKKLAAVEEGLF